MNYLFVLPYVQSAAENAHPNALALTACPPLRVATVAADATEMLSV